MYDNKSKRDSMCANLALLAQLTTIAREAALCDEFSDVALDALTLAYIARARECLCSLDEHVRARAYMLTECTLKACNELGVR